MQKQTLGEIEN